MIDRRGFMAASGGWIAGSFAGAAALGRAAGRPIGREPAFEISLAQWSLHRELQAGMLDHLDFPVLAEREFEIAAVEYVNAFFRAHDAAYVRELRRRADDRGVRSLLIMCDNEGRIGDPEEGARAACVENHRKWLEAAAGLGCHSIRVNAASAGSREEQAALAAEGLRKLTELAAAMELNVIVENHGGFSSDGTWLAGVLARVDHPRCGSLPDFGNFRVSDGVEYDRYRGVRELMPFAKAVSAKSYDFDERGEETTIDYGRMIRIVHGAGYRGHIGIEFEGGRLGEREGIRATKKLLERVRASLA